MRTVASNFFTLLVVVMVISMEQTVAGPHHRSKRVSDSHLADLETKIAFSNKIRGFAITMPVGGGRVDPMRIGRRRRSESRILQSLLDQSKDDYHEDHRPIVYNDIWYNFRHSQ